MFQKLFSLPILALAVGQLTAQTATIPAATVDITISNPSGGSVSTTYVLGGATGTPFSGAEIVVRSNDIITFGNVAAVANETACDVTGVDVTVTVPVLRLAGIGPQTQSLAFESACPFTGSVPPNLPACNAGDELYVALPGSSSSINFSSSPFPIPDGLVTGINITVTPTSTTCAPTPATATATIRVDNNAPLPVTLTSFTATRQHNRDLVAWTVEDEVNLAGYAVEQSLDGKHFEEVRFVNALGTDGGARSYGERVASATEALDATTYYRLRTVDLDGSFELSRVVAVNAGAEVLAEAELMVAPNPSRQGSGFTTNLPADPGADIQVFDLQGRLVLRRAGLTGEAIGQHLPAGSYVARVTSATVSGQCRIVVQ